MPSNNSKYYIKKLCSNKVKSSTPCSEVPMTVLTKLTGPSTSTSTSSKVDLVCYLRFYKTISLELNSRFKYQEYLL